MSNKTPIQQAIGISNTLTPGSYMIDEYTDGYNRAIQDTIELLSNLLPAERKFAKECFDAGQAHGMDIAAIMIDKSDPCSEDFSTFYKNNYEDGK